MTSINKKNITTFKIHTDILKLRRILNENKFILFYFFQFLDNKEQLILNKELKKYNLVSKIINKKTFNYVFKNTTYKNLINICNSNILLIFSKSDNLELSDRKIIDKLVKISKLKLIALKIDRTFYRPSEGFKYSTLSNNVQILPLVSILQLLTKLRINLSLIKKIK